MFLKFGLLISIICALSSFPAFSLASGELRHVTDVVLHPPSFNLYSLQIVVKCCFIGGSVPRIFHHSLATSRCYKMLSLFLVFWYFNRPIEFWMQRKELYKTNRYPPIPQWEIVHILCKLGSINFRDWIFIRKFLPWIAYAICIASITV